MKKQLVLAGGGHAHMMTLANLRAFVEKGHGVTVIGPSEHHYYSGMGPGMLGQTYRPEEVRFATRQVVEKFGGTFALGKVVRIDPGANLVHLDTGEEIPYDVLSCNLGSHVDGDIIAGDLTDIYLVKPIERLLEAQKRILELGRQKHVAVGIVGGGPSAIEIAGNVWRLTQGRDMQSAGIKIFAGSSVMPHHHPRIRAKAKRSLVDRGIEIIEGSRVTAVKTGQVAEANGKAHPLDVIFVATGVRPNRVFKDSGIPVGSDGGMTVNRYLHSPQYKNIFGGGDCIHFEDAPLDKVGVYAVRQNPVLFHNLMATLEGRPLELFEPGGDYLLIFNLGDGGGIFHKHGIQFGGRLAFVIKDFIDRRFMKKFQQMEKA